jgi:hypothetical protein
MGCAVKDETEATTMPKQLNARTFAFILDVLYPLIVTSVDKNNTDVSNLF